MAGSERNDVRQLAAELQELNGRLSRLEARQEIVDRNASTTSGESRRSSSASAAFSSSRLLRSLARAISSPGLVCSLTPASALAPTRSPSRRASCGTCVQKCLKAESVLGCGDYSRTVWKGVIKTLSAVAVLGAVASAAMVANAAAGWAPYPVRLPRDHYGHAAGIEWWYVTGLVRGTDGRRYSVFFTLFKRGAFVLPVSQVVDLEIGRARRAHGVGCGREGRKLEPRRGGSRGCAALRVGIEYVALRSLARRLRPRSRPPCRRSRTCCTEAEPA